MNDGTHALTLLCTWAARKDMMNNIQNHVEIYVCVYECERIRLARVSLNFLIPVFVK